MYPTVKEMSVADLGWLRCWFRPLGLVRRADHLVDAAQVTQSRYEGNLPRALSELIGLPGIGGYSARAIQCLAYGVPAPMIDESSGRLIRRMLGLSSAKPAYSDRRLLSLAERLVPADAGRAFNLGLLDIAFLHCHSSSPSCPICPLRLHCSLGQSVQAANQETWCKHD